MAGNYRENLDALARAAKSSGSEDDIDALIQAIEPMVGVIVRRTVGSSFLSSSDVADVTQDALVRIFIGFASWDPDRGHFSTWCFAVARHVAFDSMRRLRKHSGELLRAELVDVELEPAPYLAQVEDAALIRSVHETLRLRRDIAGRRVLAAARDLAHRGDDLTAAAIAREAELDESTARRALKRVRLLLQELEKI